MGYSRYIGRVGALAVMLGVGAALATPSGVAWAQDGEGAAGDGSAGTSQESSNTDPDTGAAVKDSSAGDPSGGGQQQSEAAEHDEEPSSSAVTVDLGGGVVVSSSGGSLPDEDEYEQEEEEEEEEEPADDKQEEPADNEQEEPAAGENENGATGGAQSTQTPPGSNGSNDSAATGQSATVDGSAPETSVSANQIDLSGNGQQPAETNQVPAGSAGAAVETLTVVDQQGPAEPVEVPPPPPAAVLTLLSNVFDPFGGTTPDAPVDAPAEWVLLAAARREVGADTTRESTLADTGDVSNSLMATAAAVMENHAPEGGVAEIPNPPNATNGAVTGKIVGVTDADNDKLTYSGSTTTAKGKVTVTSTGGFTYTPTVAARHAAAADGADPALKKDTFIVTVQDGKGGSTTVTVEVDILSKNALPTGKATVTKPNPSTGVVTVTVTGTDADKDPLSFSAPAATAKGVIVDNGNGTFTYTPNAAARSAAAVTGAPASAKTDTFNVTIDDGFGGQRAVAVTVVIAPANDNVAPTGGAFTPTGQPSPTKGAVTGTVSANDSNGDALVYKKATSPTKGSVSVSSAGVVTYTPTAAARHAASASGAMPADKQDTFQVTADDGRGGKTTFTVTVDIDPLNTAPTGKSSVTKPDATTGLVTGKITVSDAERDTVTLSGATTSTKGGEVTVNPDGTFIYKPSAAARQNARAAGAPAAAKLDNFAVTLTDGYGGTTTINVQVSVAPAVAPVNPAPIAGSPVGSPVVGTTGRIFQTISTTAPNGTVSTIVQVYQPSGAKIADTAAFSGTPSPPIVRTDGGITIVTYDPATSSATVRVISATGSMKTATVTSTSAQVVGENGRQYLLAPFFDSKVGHTRVKLVPLTTGATTPSVIDFEPTFGPDGSAVAFQVSGTAQNPSVKIVVIGSNGKARTLSVSKSQAAGIAGLPTVGANGTVYLPTVKMTDTGMSTEMLVFRSSGGATTHLIEGFTPTGNVVVAPNGTAYVLTQNFMTDEHRISVITSGVTNTPVFESSYGPTVLGTAADGTLYVLSPDPDADVSRLLIVKPNASMKTVQIGDFGFDPPHVIAPDGSIYLNVGANGEQKLVVVSPSGHARALPFYTIVEPFVPGDETLVFAKDGTAYAAVQTANGYVVHVSTNGFVTSVASNPIDVVGGHLEVGPDGTAYLVSDSGDSVTAIDQNGKITAVVAANGGTVVGPVAFGSNGTAYVTVQNGSGASATTTVWAITSLGATEVRTATGTPPGAVPGSSSPFSAVSVGAAGTVIFSSVTFDEQGNPTTHVSLADEVSVPVLRSSVTQERPIAATGVVTGRVTQAPPDSDPTGDVQYGGSTTGPLGTIVVNPDGTYTYTPSAEARNYVQSLQKVGYIDFFVKATDSTGGVAYIPVSAPILPANYPTEHPLPPTFMSDLTKLPGYIDPADWSQADVFSVSTVKAFLHNGRDVIANPCEDYDCGEGDLSWAYQVQNWMRVGTLDLRKDPKTKMLVSPEIYIVETLNPPAGSSGGERLVLGFRKIGFGEDITVRYDYPQAEGAYVTVEAMAFMPGTFPQDRFYTRIPGVVGGYIFNNEMPEDVDLANKYELDNLQEQINRKEAQFRAASSLQQGSEALMWGYQNLNPVGASSQGARAPRAVKIVAGHAVNGVQVVLDVIDYDEAAALYGNTETPMLLHTGADLSPTRIGIPED
ncbi:hypothetical protein AU197_25495 [Mycobacterium sp. IS-1590]|uniref:Ig-like domain-containing protein n=1 Tax=Mycobacterium sp. IS-1590 TaxID=1772286 RepID=UPI0007466CD0|nr:VCBS domain-containing protein [Mycobacterium sp. IS-1590]KUI43281.1 hypothetical protein AU197_25495 [Mycobacterium sp. IS-1590]